MFDGEDVFKAKIVRLILPKSLCCCGKRDFVSKLECLRGIAAKLDATFQKLKLPIANQEKL
jgi:hypothetical protein